MATEIASNSTTGAPDAKTRPAKEKQKKDTKGVVREKEQERGGEGTIKKKRKVEEEEESI